MEVGMGILVFAIVLLFFVAFRLIIRYCSLQSDTQESTGIHPVAENIPPPNFRQPSGQQTAPSLYTVIVEGNDRHGNPVDRRTLLAIGTLPTISGLVASDPSSDLPPSYNSLYGDKKTTIANSTLENSATDSDPK